MPIRVSVIVAVYNTGEYIEPLIDTLMRQTMPKDEFEVILVDDGSTDEWTVNRIDRLAAEQENVIVRHEPNSGWPGRPRNVGIDIARGTYAFFADHDDWFGLEALQRMADYADECNSDVLIGRYAGHHRGVAKAMFDKSRPSVTLESTPLMDSLTPHKLFRLDFLRAEGLRFPEGKRRLEDHVFVVDAYFRAKTISVLADYHCYVHIGRPDAGNAAYNLIDPPSYYGYVREVNDVIYRHTEPGPLRDRCLRRPLRQEVLGRLDGAGLLKRPPEHTRSVFEQARAVALDQIPEHIDAGLAPSQRVRAALLRAGRLEDLLAYVEYQAGIKARVRLTDLSWTPGGELAVAIEGALYDGSPDTPITYRRDGDALYLGEPAYGGGPAVGVRVDTGTSPLRSGALQLVVRRREDSEEWPVPMKSTQSTSENGALVSASYRASGRFDPRTLGGGRLLTPGVWDVYAKVNQTGWSKEVRLGSLRADAATQGARPAVLDGRAIVPYWTETYDNLSLDVQASGRAFVRRAAPEIAVDGDAIEVRLDAAGETLPEPRLAVGVADVTLAVHDGVLRGGLPSLPDGTYPLALLAGAPGWGAAAPLGWELVRHAGGTTARRTQPPRPAAPPAPPRPTLRERLANGPAGPVARRARRRIRRLVRRVRTRRSP